MTNIELFQRYFKNIIMIVGISRSDLSKTLQIPRMTIACLESGEMIMTIAHYIALRAWVDYAINTLPTNPKLLLAKTMGYIDNADDLSYEELSHFQNVMTSISNLKYKENRSGYTYPFNYNHPHPFDKEFGEIEFEPYRNNIQMGFNKFEWINKTFASMEKCN